MIDTHFHLICFEDKYELINGMEQDDLEFVVNIGTTVEDSIEGIGYAEQYDKLYTTVGVYPEFASDTTDDDLQKIKELALHEKVVAIGEIGLDYHRENYDSEKQKKIFVKQLEISDELGLPFCVHCRNAVEDTYNILRYNKHLINHGGLLHCYSEGEKWWKKFADLGLYFSFSGNITYKKNDVDFIKDIPLDKIVVETDAPYLTPQIIRGQKNYPRNVKYMIQKIADIKGLRYDEVEKATTENAKTFYFKIKKGEN